ncbi:head-tail connector protein [Providencia rettgeri]|nr:phage gp6-like head-tail connector protein [Providencia rettgeri]ELR5276821.1 phage gp6-like head-tail connector protein [Providencia rettgeri]
MLSLELIKQQLRLEIDYVEEDDLLTLYSAAALRLIESHTRRTLVQESEADIDPELNLVFSGDVRLAALLIIGHWYANRESVVVGASGTQLPLGFDVLLQPYVRYGI